ncbi:MAG: HAD-IA family hydrolase [Nitrospiraceae bacterium]|nr:HAD-IA family hydrolase [Nitrospiraceae bacterium]
MISLLMFDLDGTLVDSSVDITNALNYATEPYGFGQITPARTITLVGEGITCLIEKLVGEERTGIVPDVLDRFTRYYSDHLADFTEPYAGVRETLERLGGYRKAVISNKREAMSRKLLGELGLLQYFDMVLGGDSAEERKPSPVPVQKALAVFGVSPREAVMVGDSNYDIEAGRAAGVHTVAVTYGFRGIEYLKAADHIISEIGELVRLLPAIGGAEGER